MSLAEQHNSKTDYPVSAIVLSALGDLWRCGRSVGVGKLPAICYLFNSLYPAVYEVKNTFLRKVVNTFLRKVVNKAKLLT